MSVDSSASISVIHHCYFYIPTVSTHSQGLTSPMHPPFQIQTEIIMRCAHPQRSRFLALASPPAGELVASPFRYSHALSIYNHYRDQRRSIEEVNDGPRCIVHHFWSARPPSAHVPPRNPREIIAPQLQSMAGSLIHPINVIP